MPVSQNTHSNSRLFGQNTTTSTATTSMNSNNNSNSQGMYADISGSTASMSNLAVHAKKLVYKAGKQLIKTGKSVIGNSSQSSSHSSSSSSSSLGKFNANGPGASSLYMRHIPGIFDTIQRLLHSKLCPNQYPYILGNPNGNNGQTLGANSRESQQSKVFLLFQVNGSTFEEARLVHHINQHLQQQHSSVSKNHSSQGQQLVLLGGNGVVDWKDMVKQVHSLSVEQNGAFGTSASSGQEHSINGLL